ncbi:ABC transporter permease [Paenibacillus mucilaginosus]|uniref:Binding-protein-dependent transport systems inner membrane component n=1 Tax=Paenibacillus mucilaginosus (strain KNP414) TaxID=1036673 RepID=F8F6M4_PAEMK|nr:ABC transporter permease subunit [Paenibacillus mucilaginosus]AEI42978.1 binding-protein-dependent transport systems inner membrane component [Paenibacillus mucilaginosus KNP414]MCG7216089.1 ABC transporter permease subunit [Paenibacillus mucilaginosus]
MNEYHLYLIFLPVLIYYLIFRYMPIIGSVVLSFIDFNMFKGIADSPWVGLKHFLQFFDSIYFWRLLRNTLMINLLNLVFVFPMPILFALLMNEVRSKILKRSVQTISYLPHFVSTVIMASMAVTFLSPSIGFVNNFLPSFGGERIAFLQKPEYFWGIYTVLDIWKTMGWSAILYFAALTGINGELYEAAMVDGANRWKQMLNITLPGILPTIIIMLLLKIGHMLDIGYEVILLLYNPSTYETADVINTYVYRKGVIEASYSFSSAVGLFQSVIGLILIVAANRLARKYADSSMW